MSAENIAIARRWFEEVWNQRRAETIDELVTPDSLCYTDNGVIRGADEFRQQMYEPFLAAFPEIVIQVEDAIGQGDHVVVRWTAAAKHAGAGLGFASTGRDVQFRGLTWVQIRDGKFGVGWQSSNIPEVVRGLSLPQE
ncbi:ester cyclase [Anatilimnocola floriformis]|uniref:ester cyclase n=1 Tax=Anatilimnocola floriformis TaxID=2948575 RepID=UPI0020C334D8|nr:ester cyclase [Anatilimnocola floriformis]